MALRRGFELERGERALVVEDVVTTGGSATEVVALLRELGAAPVAVGAIVNRSGGNPFEALDLPLVALAEVRARTWQPADAPPELAGSTPVKPGSRPRP
jgi:orotate phosphoribosyltransferase